MTYPTNLARRAIIKQLGSHVILVSAGAGLVGCSRPASDRDLLDLVSKAPGFVAGAEGAPVLGHVVFDPQCEHCATLWRNFRPLWASAALAWHPIALSETSREIAAAMLASSSPVQAFEAQHAHAASGLPGIAQWQRDAMTKNPTGLAEKSQAIRAATEALLTAGVESVPLVLRAGVNGMTPAMKEGSAQTSQIAAFLGIRHASP